VIPSSLSLSPGFPFFFLKDCRDILQTSLHPSLLFFFRIDWLFLAPSVLFCLSALFQTPPPLSLLTGAKYLLVEGIHVFFLVSQFRLTMHYLALSLPSSGRLKVILVLSISFQKSPSFYHQILNGGAVLSLLSKFSPRFPGRFLFRSFVCPPPNTDPTYSDCLLG